MARGLIVYFDGPDGVGKSTQVKKVAEALRSYGKTVYDTHTFGGSPIGEQLREVVLSDSKRPPEADLHIAMACQHAALDDLLKRREAGEIVLIDRSPLSIIAYQVYGSGLQRDKGYEGATELIEQVMPDLLIVYEASEDSLKSRRAEQSKHKATDYFNSKPDDFHAKVAEGYADSARHFMATVIDADSSIDDVFQATMAKIHSAVKA